METPQLTDAQRELVTKNLDLAHHLALVVWRSRPHHVDRDEIIAVAYEALVTAAYRFDPSRANVVDGVADVAGAFAGYARRRINGAILDWQRREDHVPRRHRTVYKELQALGLQAGRPLDELSVLTGMPVERLRAIIAAVEVMPVTLTPPSHPAIAHEGAQSKNERLTGFARPVALPSDNVEDMAMEARIKQAVVEVFDALTQPQRVIIALRYYEGMDLPAVAATLGMSLTTTRSMHAEALLRIHEAMVHEAI